VGDQQLPNPTILVRKGIALLLEQAVQVGLLCDLLLEPGRVRARLRQLLSQLPLLLLVLLQLSL
jgi:hypothetical protein